LYRLDLPARTKKVIPHPQSAPTFPQPVIDPQNRIIINIGKQRIALDISCQATYLNPVPTSMAEAPVPVNGRGGKGRKAPKP
jgi:hypothetical protein